MVCPLSGGEGPQLSDGDCRSRRGAQIQTLTVVAHSMNAGELATVPDRVGTDHKKNEGFELRFPLRAILAPDSCPTIQVYNY